MKPNLSRIRTLHWRQWQLLAEAGLFLAAAAAAIALLPFARVARLAGREGPATGRAPEAGQLLELRWAIQAIARRVPFRSKCFEQGLAAQWMLHRRGVETTLFYGAARREGGELIAHVWVRSGERDVIGCEEAADFATLARFPPQLPNR
nr:lasso peptide biosynthesis B2 protein [uncultured Sphingomonas sp.]